MSPRIVLPPQRPLADDGSLAGGWWHRDDGSDRIVCDLCPRECKLHPGDRGFCFVRENRDGEMFLTTYGRSSGFCIDPIEKKPLNHFYPGTSVLSFGTAGCNLGCKFCQNWSISKSREIERASESADASTIAGAAKQLGCHSVAFTYNDPVIWAEYAMDVARACRAQGVRTVAVTAGYITPAARAPFYQHIDAANVDLKAFTEHFYQHMTLSHLQPVLDTLEWLVKESQVWLEITNLVIPNANDDDDEFRRMCDWLLDHLGPQVPLHFTAFHPDFRLRDRAATPPETLLRAREIAVQAGLHHVYVGNVHDQRHQSTYCPQCGCCLIERDWYQLGSYRLRGNQCEQCGAVIAGHFASQPGNWGRRREPVAIQQFAGLGKNAPLEPTRHEPSVVQIDVVRSTQNSSDTRSGMGDVGMDQESRTDSRKNESRPITLSGMQERAILRAAALHIGSACGRVALFLEDAELAGVANATVIGCFVTLKRNTYLRACCGMLGTSTPLHEALTQAAVATAMRDERFPAVSPRELCHLQLSVSLLHNLRVVNEPPASRASAIEIGRHGVQIHSAGHRGLLLPNVATEHQLDAEGFLRQVCGKAGLPSDAWQSEATRLYTFESILIESDFPPDIAAQVAEHDSFFIDAPTLTRLFEFCRANVLLEARGATPGLYLADCPDGMVTGVALRLRLPEDTGAWQASKLVLRPGVPLQASLSELTRAAAVYLRATVPTERLSDVDVDVAILHDPAHLGPLAHADLRGWRDARQAFLCVAGGRQAWILDTQSEPGELVQQVMQLADLPPGTAGAAMSLCVEGAADRLRFTNAPQPNTTTGDRRAAVAGTFYPGDPSELRAAVQRLFQDPAGTAMPTAQSSGAGVSPTVRGTYAAAMVPHAGWRFSGRIAAQVFDRIEFPERVIVIGPKHTRSGVNWAVAPCSQWLFPGGSMRGDTELAQELVSAISGLQLDVEAHAQEHAIEVELPLLAHCAPQASVVGIAIGSADWPACQLFARGLAQVLQRDSRPPLLLISSDMNHFADDETTRRLDRLALDAMQTLDGKTLFDTVRQSQISMCGVLPAVIVLEALRQVEGQFSCQRVAYGTSADVTGDTTRVVGYAGMLIENLSSAQ